MSATNPEARRWKVGDTLHPGEWRNLPEGAEYDVTHHYRVDPVAGGVEVGSIRTITKLPEPLTWTESFDKAPQSELYDEDDPIDYPCEECGADAGEECRPYCTGIPGHAGDDEEDER